MWKVYESILPADVDLEQVADRKGLKGADICIHESNNMLCKESLRQRGNICLSHMSANMLPFP